MALTMDAFRVMSQGLRALQNENQLIQKQLIYNSNIYNGTKGIQCDSLSSQTWGYGDTIAQHFKQVTTPLLFSFLNMCTARLIPKLPILILALLVFYFSVCRCTYICMVNGDDN